MCSLRDAADQFGEAGVQVYGLSLDDVASQAAFAKAQELGFPLLSDPDGSVAKKCGALMQGRPFARRVTFILDDKGLLRHVTTKVEVREHGQQLLDLIVALRR